MEDDLWRSPLTGKLVSYKEWQSDAWALLILAKRRIEGVEDVQSDWDL